MTTLPNQELTFLRAVEFVLRHEGGFSDDAADPGGATNYGITLHELCASGHLDGLDTSHISVSDLRAMTRDQAIDFYRQEYWIKFGLDRINTPDIAVKVFDTIVNVGIGEATRLLQRAIRASWFALAEDGQLGPETIRATNAAEPRSLIAALKSEQAGFYRLLCSQKPVLSKFLTGWLNRAYEG